MKEEDGIPSKSAIGLGIGLVLVAWILTGGMMLLHIASWAVGVTNLKLALLGILFPPIGVVNGVTFLFTGENIGGLF